MSVQMLHSLNPFFFFFFCKVIISGYNTRKKNLCHHTISCIKHASQATKPLRKSRLPYSLLPCFENWNTLHSCSHCLRAAQVNSCNSVFRRDNSPKPVGFSLHLCPFNLNSTCFGFVNWLCSLWPCYFLFVLHTWELILFLLDLHPVQYACRRCCYLICSCDASSSFHSPGNGHRAVWMEGGADSTQGMARTLFSIGHLWWSTSGGRVEVTCLL